MEPSGAGLALLFLLTPVATLALSALYTWRLAVPLVAIVLVLGLAARWFFLAGGPWVAVILVPVMVASIAMAVHTARIVLAEQKKE